MRKVQMSVQQFAEGLLRGDKVVLGQAITLVESQKPDDVALATQLIHSVLPHTGQSVRVGVSGVPGVGKSTFIEGLGKYLTGLKKKVAVLAIDPTSVRTHGSILGDKTRMEELAKDERAFIRPTASGGRLGGVAGRTREAILLCEAAGYEVILIETVGVGQSETAVRNMTDFFMLLMLAGAGDELQGIKKGIVEMADALVINKADGDNLARVKSARADLQHAIHFLPSHPWGWQVPVLTCSALQRKDIDTVWDTVEKFCKEAKQRNVFDENRSRQQVNWMHEAFDQELRQLVEKSEGMAALRHQLEEDVRTLKKSAPEAAHLLLKTWQEKNTRG